VLGPALFLVAILFLSTTVALAGIGAFARATIHDAANALVRTGYQHALADYQVSIAAQIGSAEGGAYYSDGRAIQNSGDVPSIPQLVDPAHNISDPAPRTEQIGAYYLSETVTNTTVAAPSCTAGAPGTSDDIVVNAQCALWVGESRLSAQIVVSVYSGDPKAAGTTLLAARTQTVALRLFADAPFVALTGLKDGDARDPNSDDPNVTRTHEGDVGGYAPAEGPLEGSQPLTPGDTTIHVFYECQNRGAACPQNPHPPGDQPLNIPWRSGNVSPPN